MGYLLHSGDPYGLWSWLPVTRRCQAVGMCVADRVGLNRHRAAPRATKIATARGQRFQTLPVRTEGVSSLDVARIGPFATTRSWGHLSEVDTPYDTKLLTPPSLGVELKSTNEFTCCL